MKSSLLLPGFLALTLAVAPSVLPAMAQTQSTPAVKPQKGANKLNLTDAQKAQLKAIRDRATQRVVSEVLTDAQRQTYNAAIARGEKPRQVMRQFTFDDAQNQKLVAIRQNTRTAMEQFVQTLSPEQQKAWQARRDRIQSRNNQRINRPQQQQPVPQGQSL